MTERGKAALEFSTGVVDNFGCGKGAIFSRGKSYAFHLGDCCPGFEPRAGAKVRSEPMMTGNFRHVARNVRQDHFAR